MAKRPVEWGWRIYCLHPECTSNTESWSTEGTPPLHHLGLHAEGPHKGWYFAFRPVSFPKGHIAFCPQHTQPVLDWLKASKQWREGRRQFVQTVLDKPLCKLYQMVAPKKKQQLAQEAGLKWDLQNLAPIPPWLD